MSDVPPILDYAPPPASLSNRLRERIGRHPILSFFFLRKLSATEVALSAWPLLCLFNLLLAANSYFLASSFDSWKLYILMDLVAPGIALITLAAIGRLLGTRRVARALLILAITLLIGRYSGVLENVLTRYPLDHYEDPPNRVPDWMNDLPYWKYL